MILVIEVLSVIILAMMLWTVFIDEKRSRRRDMRVVKLKGFWDGGERRSTDRMSVTLGVKCFRNGKSNNVESVDISAKGIRLLLDEKFEKGLPLRLEIKLPDQEKFIRAKGDVVWSNEATDGDRDPVKRLFNTGIKFSSFYDTDEKRLFDFIYRTQPEKG